MPQPVYLRWTREPERNSYDTKTLLDYDGYRYLHTWQAGCCAMCGNDKASMVLDHCHESGLARGFLCSPCNTKEGTSFNDVEWEIYRKFPPTVLLDLKFYYNDFGRAPYPVQAEISKEKVDTKVKTWDNEFCYQVVKEYCNYKSSLHWINSSDMRELIRKSIAYVRESSAYVNKQV